MGQQDDSAVLGTLMKFIGVMAVGAVFIFFLAGSMVDDAEQAGTDTAMDKEIEARIAPVADVTVAGDKPAGAVKKLSGEEVYNAACAACHGTGVAGAPKFGDKAAWAPRIGQGKATLYTNAINGKGGMPAKGGRADLDDATIKATVDYMVSNSQ